MLLGEFSEAIKDFDKALDLDTKDVFSWTFRGETYRKMGQLDKALADFDKALHLNPTYYYALINRGHVRRAQRDYEAAIADYNALIKASPGAYPLMYRGLALLEMDKAEEAQKDFDESLKLYPGIKEELDKEIARSRMANENVASGKS